MKVYRGPGSKIFGDFNDEYELVAVITPQELQECFRHRPPSIKFNVTKPTLTGKHERQAVCIAQFEDEDLLAMISASVSRLIDENAFLADERKDLQKTYDRILDIVEAHARLRNADQKLAAIRLAFGLDET